MSSSCVPPKNCVVHDPDPGSHDNDDSRSECGSLCTCTSSSMTSIATSVSRDPRGSSASLDNPAVSSAPSGTSATPQAQETSDNPFIVVFVPSQMLSGRQGCGTCGTCYGEAAMKTALRVILRTSCEFCPWVAGFVIIYYTFYWWGLGSGFSAFLLMMGTHALIRFIRARSSSKCLLKCSRRDDADAPNVRYSLGYSFLLKVFILLKDSLGFSVQCFIISMKRLVPIFLFLVSIQLPTMFIF